MEIFLPRKHALDRLLGLYQYLDKQIKKETVRTSRDNCNIKTRLQSTYNLGRFQTVFLLCLGFQMGVVFGEGRGPFSFLFLSTVQQVSLKPRLWTLNYKLQKAQSNAKELQRQNRKHLSGELIRCFKHGK